MCLKDRAHLGRNQVATPAHNLYNLERERILRSRRDNGGKERDGEDDQRSCENKKRG